MKNKKIFRPNAVNTLLALSLIGFIALGCNSNFSFGEAEMPPQNELQSLVRTTLIDFADAVEKGDFTDFHKTTSSDFQDQFPPDKLKTTFEVFIEKRDAVLPVFNKAVTLDAEFKTPPSIINENFISKLKTEGSFRSSPSDVTFNFEYLHEDGKWKVIRVEVFVVPN